MLSDFFQTMYEWMATEADERMADQCKLAAGGYAFDLSSVDDPSLREVINRKMERFRAEEELYRRLASEARDRGD